MKKIFETIKLWLDSEMQAMAARRHAHHVAAIEEEAQARIQVREFEGGLYISYDDKPLLEARYLSHRPEELMEAARKTYVRYKLTRHEARS